MEQPIVTIYHTEWQVDNPDPSWMTALEAGKVLYFPHLTFSVDEAEKRFFTPAIRDPSARNISFDTNSHLKGAVGDTDTRAALAAMIARFGQQAQRLIDTLFPYYRGALRRAPTSYRPEPVERRVQSWRADDRRLHVDAFPSRPNYGERILRIFSNVNPERVPRVWRVGEPFEAIAERFLPNTKSYSAWRAKWLYRLRITKSLRGEYDHLMLQLHDAMKSNLNYQRDCEQTTIPFPAGSTWVCFSDQTSHAVMSGQYLMEQTFHLPVAQQHDPDASPLAVLTRLVGRQLV